MLVPRVQFLAIEIARNRRQLNSVHLKVSEAANNNNHVSDEKEVSAVGDTVAKVTVAS